MNPIHGDTATSVNSSRTSYFYPSESDRLSLRRLTAQRSRINRLFRENYIPSKEIKLIDKLVKTRALYDDVRTQLLSVSSISVSEKAILKPLKYTPAMGKELEEAERISDISAMISLVDKGIGLGPRKLSQCCSSCSCNDRSRFHEHPKRSRRRKCTGGMTSNSSGMSNDVQNNARFETKNIKSEPCTCTSKHDELKKHQSKSFLKKSPLMQTTQIIEPTFLGFFPIDEHNIQSNKKSLQKPKRCEVHTITKIEKNMEPIKKSPQSKSNRRRCIDTLEKGKAVEHLDKDIQTRLNKSLLNTVEHFLLQNIPMDNEVDVKEHFVTKLKNISPKKLHHLLDEVESNRGQHLTNEWSTLKIDKSKIKYPYDIKHVQGISNAYNVSMETNPINNRKYRIVTRRRKHATKSAKPQVSAQSKANLQINNSSNQPLNYNENQAIMKSGDSSKTNHQCSEYNENYPLHNSCLCTFKSIPQKDVVAKETAMSNCSCSVRSRTPSEPMLPMKSLKQYPIKTNRMPINNDDDFDIKIKSAHSMSQVETVNNCDKEVAPKLNPCSVIRRNNKVIIDSNSNEFVHINKTVMSRMKRVHRGTDNEMLIRYKLSKVSCRSIAKSKQTVIKHKFRRCLCKLKLIRPQDTKIKQMTIPTTGAQNIQQRGPYKQTDKPHRPIKHGGKEFLHITEADIICDNKCMIKSASAIKPDFCQAELGTELSLNLGKGNLKELNLPDYNGYHKHQGVLKIREEKKSMAKTLQEHTEKKGKFAIMKLAKEEKSLSFGPVMKRCLCTLKLHKKGRNAFNNKTANVATKTDLQVENIHPDLEKIKSFIKQYSSKPLEDVERKKSASKRDIFQRSRPKSMLVKPHLQEKIIATENKQISRKSQVKIKTRDKNFDVRPKVKRCFCTLPLLKKNKNLKSNICACVNDRSYANYNVATPEITLPNQNLPILNRNHKTKSLNLAHRWCALNKSSSSMFSVSTIEIESKIMQSCYRKNECKLIRPDSNTAASLSSQNILRFKSKLSFQLNCLAKENDVDSYYNSLSRRTNRKSCHYSKCVKLETSQSQLTGIRPLLRSCYCAMNIQMANRGQYHHKLKPYECEPGVCVPYECDPLDCQKRIMKRLMKTTSTMSETIKLQSNSSSTAVAGARAKKLQSNAVHEPRRVERKHKYECPPQCETFQSSGKQAVRLGSSFKFDIEFSKSSNRKKSMKEGRPSTSSRSSRTTDKKFRTDGTHGMSHKRHDMESQSAVMKMRHRASAVRPMVKRCFCTLKLQKKGRQQQKLLDLNVDQGTSTPPNTIIVPTAVETGQNTKPLKPEKIPKLLPYECEPGVCLPGQCDPHACLELINKRQKNKGTNSIRSNRTSSSSTAAKRKMQMKGKNIQSHKESRVQPVRNIPKPKPERTAIEPSRQVVRIGSNFSFNIEFFRDQSPGSNEKSPARSPQKHENHQVKAGLKSMDRGSEGKQFALRSQDSQAVPRSVNKGLGVTPMLKRCFCTLKLQKPKETVKKVKKEKEHASFGTETPVNKPVADLYSRSVMTVGKPGHKLLPYECEPGVCVPGSCDPYECEKRIKKRLMNRGSGTGQRRTKSVSSSVKRGRKVRNSQVAAIHREQKRYENIKQPQKPIEPCGSRPSGQVVRIRSNFSFNIDFFKENCPGGTTATTHVPKPQPERPENNKKTASVKSVKTAKKITRGEVCKCPSAKNKKVQRGKATRDMDSQILAKKMQSTMTGVTPFLKRCFCTLKLQKLRNVKTPTETKAVATKTGKYRDYPQIDAMDQGTRTKKAQIQRRKLEPYECEPGVCIPGECDPYECAKRIKIREMKSKHTGTMNREGRSVSSLVSVSSKFRARKTRANKGRRTSQGPRRSSGRERKQRQSSTCSSSPPRQAVRIGSCFSFNVEFYKDKSPCSSVCLPPVCKPDCPKQCNKKINYRTTETNPRKVKTMSTLTGGTDLRHNHAKSQALETESKGSGIRPALKRCFCTLKLQKIGSQQQKAKKKTDNTAKHISTSTSKKKPEILVVAGKEVGTKTKRTKVTYNLEPYECEPGVCTPGQCDPHECLKRIKQRQMRNLGTETQKTAMRTTSSVTSREKKKKAKKSQKHTEKLIKEQEPSLCPKPLKPRRPPPPPPLPQRVTAPAHASQAVEDINRQVVRIGSNFSFNIEFHKDCNGSPSPSPRRNKSLVNSSTSNDNIQFKNKEASCKRKNCHNIKCQAECVKTESRGSGMGPLLKRCFCTLALQNTSTGHTTKEDKMKVKKATPKAVTENKTTSTKKKYAPPVKQMDLEPYECEPGVCVPGECDPYECLERIKKRGVTRKSQTVEAVGKSKKLQSNIKGPSKIDSQTEANFTKADPKSMIVEQPRFPLLFDRGNRQVVRISSNFSFNIEFFKDVSPPATTENDCNQIKCYAAKKTKCDKPCAVQTGLNKIKCEKKCGYCGDSRSCQSQSDSPRTENKSSGVGKLLKRCFCTAKLNNQSVHGPRAVTVGRVENIGPSFPYMRQDYWVQYQTQQITAKKQNKANSRKGLCQHCNDVTIPTNIKSKTNDSAEMKTILPYSPAKFGKNISHSVIPKKNNSEKRCNQIVCYDSAQVNKIRDVSKKPNLKGAKRLTMKKSESDIIDDRIHTKVQKSAIKEFVCRCMQVFSRRRNKPNGHCRSESIPTGLSELPLKSNGINPSKSERRSKVDDTNTSPKKSKSLKVANVSNNKKGDDKKRKFSRFQSGDDGQIERDKQINCPRGEDRFKEGNKLKSPTKLVHFSLSSHGKNEKKSKQNTDTTEKNKNGNNPPCIALCPCCGGFKITKVDPKSKETASPNCSNMPDQSPVDQNKNTCCSCVGRCACPKLKTTNKPARCRCVGRCLCPKLKTEVDTNKYSGKKCICGSAECSKEVERLKRESKKQRDKKPSKPCVCGSKICGAEKAKSERHGKDHVCKCESSLESDKKKKLASKQKKLREKEKRLSDKKQKLATEKRDKETAKKRYQAFLERQARYKKEDAIRKKKRIEIDKRMLKDVKKYKNSGNAMLITESVLDVAKLGFVSAGDIVRSVSKAAIDPKFTFQKIKTTVTEPSRIWTKLKSAADDSPGISTMKRVKMRMKETSCVKTGTETLEKYPVTHYMLHMTDKNPKKRLLNRPKNKRVKIDFQCSPYMLSLRKKPHLSVYLCCPWFYPHCISLINIWRQFTDVLLFLLAVTVWSPCIFCMEACRALMCCFLCTG